MERTFDIGGMTCASCVGRVTKAVRKVDGVANVQVNLATETALVDYDPSVAAARRPDRRHRRRRVHRDTPPSSPSSTPGRPADSGHARARTPTSEDRDAARDAELASLKRKWQVALADRARDDDLDVRPAAAGRHGLADAGAARGLDRRAVLGRAAVLHRGLGGGPAPSDEHEHAGGDRHRRRLRVQRVRHAVARRRPVVGAAAARLLRDVAGDHRADPDGPLDGGAGEAAHRGRDQGADRARAEDRAGAARRRRGRRADRRRRRSGIWSGSGRARRSRSTAS